MSKTLSLVEHLLDRARRLEALGLDHQARQVLERLGEFRQLPAEIAEETQHRLAGLLSEADDLVRVRRHLATVLSYQPKSAEYHAEMARALCEDESCDPAEALPYYERAIRREPNNSRYLCEYGLLALRLDQTEQGLSLLRRAAETAPDDVETLDDVATGLAEADIADEARRMLHAAMFRNSADRRFRELYRKHQFRWLSDEQARRAAIPFPEPGPVLLPFVRPTPKKRRFEIDGQIFRIDAAQNRTGPRRHSPQTSRKKKTR